MGTSSYMCSDLYQSSGAHCTPGGMKLSALQMGVKTGTIAEALTHQYHQMPSVGECFDVCVAGFALQGGLGLIFRYHGTAADFIQSMDVVTVG